MGAGSVEEVQNCAGVGCRMLVVDVGLNRGVEVKDDFIVGVHQLKWDLS